MASGAIWNFHATEAIFARLWAMCASEIRSDSDATLRATRLSRVRAMSLAMRPKPRAANARTADHPVKAAPHRHASTAYFKPSLAGRALTAKWQAAKPHVSRTYASSA